MKSVILTGATGAVGMALIRELLANGIEVLVICNPGSSRNKKIPEHPLIRKIECSLAELRTLENSKKKEYDVFYHFAWAGTTGQARNDMYLQNSNVRYALDAVEVAKKFGCKLFVGAGSQAEYGRTEGILRSYTPVFPETGYGIGKLAAGQMTREYAHQLGLKHIWVRILSVYGVGDGNQSMVMSTIEKVRLGIVPQMTGCEQIWDYLNSKDAARAFFLLGANGSDGKTYVLGSGQGRPLKEYVEIIKSCVNSKSGVAYGAVPYSEKQVMHLVADPSDIKNDTGWKPIVSFREGILEILRKGELE